MWQISEVTALRNLIQELIKDSNEAWFNLGAIKFVVNLSPWIPPVISSPKEKKKLRWNNTVDPEKVEEL